VSHKKEEMGQSLELSNDMPFSHSPCQDFLLVVDRLDDSRHLQFEGIQYKTKAIICKLNYTE